MITKNKLNFDPAENDDYDVVKSYLSASDGTLLTHTGSALDVNIKTSDIQISVDSDHTEDSIRLGDGSSFFTSTSENGDIALDVHLSNTSIAVTATDLDIRDLDHSQDSVKVGDGADFLAVNTDGSINIKDASLDSYAYSAKSVTNSATDLVTTELSGRKLMSIQNRGTKSVFLGCDSSVTTATGTEVPKGATAEFPFGPGINVHAITASGTAEIRIIELA